MGENQTLYAPTGLALGEGGLWATEHSASAMAFLNFTTGRWTIYPTSTVPYTPWVLTYFDASNGTAVWFNEHYGNRMGVIYDNATQLTEYNVSNPPLYNLTTITDPTSGVNMVTMGLAAGRGVVRGRGGLRRVRERLLRAAVLNLCRCHRGSGGPRLLDKCAAQALRGGLSGEPLATVL